MNATRQEQSLVETSLEDIVETRQRALEKIDELKAAVSVLDEEIRNHLEKEGLNSDRVGEYSIAIKSRTTISTKVEQARELGAVKKEWVVDKDAIKLLLDRGIPVPGVSKSSWVEVSILRKQEEGVDL